jgi:hypothetical protein
MERSNFWTSSESVSVSGPVFRLNEEGHPWQLRPEISSS